MNIYANFSHQIETLLSKLFTELTDFSRVALDPPRDPSHGDLSTNAAMVLAKSVNCKPLKA
jgi:arginyl-tRNA synthetase